MGREVGEGRGFLGHGSVDTVSTAWPSRRSKGRLSFGFAVACVIMITVPWNSVLDRLSQGVSRTRSGQKCRHSGSDYGILWSMEYFWMELNQPLSHRHIQSVFYRFLTLPIQRPRTKYPAGSLPKEDRIHADLNLVRSTYCMYPRALHCVISYNLGIYMLNLPIQVPILGTYFQTYVRRSMSSGEP